MANSDSNKNNKKGLSRRSLLVGGAAIGVGAAVGLRPGNEGATGHDDYFSAMSDALQTTLTGKPSLVVDKRRMRQNIQTIKSHVKGRFEYRIVAKSLPSLPMLNWMMQEAQTNKLMVFHQPFLNGIAQSIPQADVLMGKPMPINAVKTFYSELKDTSFDASKQLQWLVDNPERLEQYQALASDKKINMRINIELDVGLHRGGVNQDKTLIEMLKIIEGSEQLSLSGFMGYEAHVGKVPGDAYAQRDDAMAIYSHFLELSEQYLQRDLKGLTLNGAGSPTYQFYNEGQWPVNELSAGSCIAKPTDFDIDSLQDHIPACFIASPVIKVLSETQIPGVKGLGKIMAMWDQNLEKTFFAYGGYWKAKPESPKGLRLNPVYGRSSNQEMYNGSMTIDLKQDDFIFLRPTQSEAVFLQFGDILVYEDGKIVDSWPVLS